MQAMLNYQDTVKRVKYFCFQTLNFFSFSNMIRYTDEDDTKFLLNVRERLLKAKTLSNFKLKYLSEYSKSLQIIFS